MRNDVLKETNGQQVPWEHSALTGRFYFDPTAAALRPPPADEVTWTLIKGAKDPALLTDPKTFCALLGKLIPVKVAGDAESSLVVGVTIDRPPDQRAVVC